MFPALWHRYLFLFGLFGLAAGMLFGAIPTSVPEFFLMGNWLVEGGYKKKWDLLKRNKIFWVLISFFLLHLFGMIYTSNFSRGLDDLRNKLPLFILPFTLFSAEPITKKEFKIFLQLFLLSVITSSILCFFVYLGYGKHQLNDVRDASVFISHIRFSLIIALAVCTLGYFIYTEKGKYKFIYFIPMIWLLFYLYKLEMATGLICLVFVIFILIPWLLYKKANGLISVLITASCFILAGYLIASLNDAMNLFDKDPLSPANVLKDKTAQGNPYLQDTMFNLAENGNLITININDGELRKEWNKKSTLSYDSVDMRHNNLRFTILRYLSSKGLTKDSVGLNSLKDQDIRNIENGVSNYRYPISAGMKTRWRELIWEYTKYKRGENPSGHTLTMRLEFWKTGWMIIREHPILGVGTGDIQDAFNDMYTKSNSKLDAKWRLRNHNQYLAITVAFGLVGLIVFLIYLLYPVFLLRKKLHPLYWAFFIIALISFIAEDTLETQTGVTFIALYHTLFLWLASGKNQTKETST